MPQQRTPLSTTRIGNSFTVSEAMHLGVSAGVLRHPRLSRPFHGLRSLEESLAPGASLHERVMRSARDFAPKLKPGEAFSHTTALLLLRCPIWCDPVLHVTTPGSTLRRQRGIVGHCANVEMRCIELGSGVVVAAPALALAQAAGFLAFTELVVAADHLVRADQGWLGLRDLLADSALFSGRGSRRLRAALGFVRVGAESRMETLTRLLMEQYGLAEGFELQVDLHDAGGRWIGRFDLVDRRRKLIVEYDGEQHRSDRSQYLKDQRRLDHARAAGYRILRLHHEDVVDAPEATAQRIANFIGAPLRPRSPQLMRLFREGR